MLLEVQDPMKDVQGLACELRIVILAQLSHLPVDFRVHDRLAFLR